MTEWVTRKLANWAMDLRPEDLPDDVLAKAEDCIIDAIACAVPGRCAWAADIFCSSSSQRRTSRS